MPDGIGGGASCPGTQPRAAPEQEVAGAGGGQAHPAPQNLPGFGRRTFPRRKSSSRHGATPPRGWASSANYWPHPRRGPRRPEDFRPPDGKRRPLKKRRPRDDHDDEKATVNENPRVRGFSGSRWADITKVQWSHATAGEAIRRIRRLLRRAGGLPGWGWGCAGTVGCQRAIELRCRHSE